MQNNLSVRYNAETDYIQAFYGGVWNNTVFAGLHEYWLYKDGGEFINRTGGWIGKVLNETGSITKYGDRMSVYASHNAGDGYAFYGATPINRIDLTNFTKLQIDASCSGSGQLGFSVVMYSASGGSVTPIDYRAIFPRKLWNIDVSSYKGYYDIRLCALSFGTNSACTVNIYTVKLL